MHIGHVIRGTHVFCRTQKVFAVLYCIEIVLSKDGLNSYLVIRSKRISQQIIPHDMLYS